MKLTKARTLTEPRVEQADKLRITGISRFYPFEGVAEIPDPSRLSGASIVRASSKARTVTYGVIYSADADSFDYLSVVI